jgi:hypothetical protein
MNIKHIIFGTVFLTCSLLAISGQSQLLYSVTLKGGLSNSNPLNRAYVYDDDGFIIKGMRKFTIGNTFSYGPMFSIEAGIIEKIKDRKFSFEQGVGIESKSFYGQVAKEFSDTENPEKWEATYYSLTIPVKIRYELAKSATLYGGVNNIFNIGQTGIIETLTFTQKYNVRGMVGVDAILFKKYILGCEYSYDITPYSKWKEYNVSYRFDLIALKLGLVF